MRLAERAAERAGSDHVSLAYLQFSEPTIEQAADEAAQAGASRLVVVPLFLATGKHVSVDIGAAVGNAAARHHGLAVEILPPVGSDPRLWSLLDVLVAETMRPEETGDLD